MGIGQSNLTKKQLKEYQAEFKKLNTPAERIVWLANAEVDAMVLTNLDTDEEYWVPLLNCFRMADGSKSIKYESRDQALLEAIKNKQEYLDRINQVLNSNDENS